MKTGDKKGKGLKSSEGEGGERSGVEGREEAEGERFTEHVQRRKHTSSSWPRSRLRAIDRVGPPQFALLQQFVLAVVREEITK